MENSFGCEEDVKHGELHRIGIEYVLALFIQSMLPVYGFVCLASITST